MRAVMWQQAKREGSKAKFRIEPISYNQAGSWGRPDSLLNSSKLVRSFPGLAWLLVGFKTIAVLFSLLIL